MFEFDIENSNIRIFVFQVTAPNQILTPNSGVLLSVDLVRLRLFMKMLKHTSLFRFQK